MNELFTCSTALKFVNALDEPSLKLSLSYQGLRYRISNSTMEEIGATNAKYVPAIASFMASVCAPTLEEPFSWHSFTHLLNK